MARPFAVAGLTVLFVCAVLFFLPERIYGWVAVFFGLLFAAFAVLTARGHKGLRAVTLVSFCGAVAAAAIFVQARLVYYPTLSLQGDGAQITATVIGREEARYGRWYTELRLDSVNGRDVYVKARLSATTPYYPAYGDVLTFSGDIYPLGETDPGIAESYKAKGMYLGVLHPAHLTVTKPYIEHMFEYILKIRDYTLDTLDRLFPGEPGQLLQGMLLGEENLPYATANAFRRLGISHLFAVSGLHMSLLAWSVYRALALLFRKSRFPAVFTILFVLFFMALTGFTASACRAGIMMMTLLVGKLFDRNADSLNSLGFAALLLVLPNPLSAGAAGLQLSFGCTLGILLFRKPPVPPDPTLMKPKPSFGEWAIQSVAASLRTTLFASAFFVPICLLRFSGAIPLITPLTNLLLVPPASLLLLIAAVGTLVSPLPVLANAVSALGLPLLRLYLRVVRSVSALPFPSLLPQNRFPLVTLAVLAMVICVFLVLSYFRRARIWFRLAAFCGVLSVPVLSLYGFANARTLTLTLLAADRSTSVLVSQGDRNLLLGVGGSSMTASYAEQALEHRAAAGLDALVVPHCDAEYPAGVIQLLRDIPVTKTLSAVADDAASYISPAYGTLAQGLTQSILWDGVQFAAFVTKDSIAVRLQTTASSAAILFDAACKPSALPQGFLQADTLVCFASPPEGLDLQTYKTILFSCPATAAKNILQTILSRLHVPTLSRLQEPPPTTYIGFAGYGVSPVIQLVS
ncbi:MAG: ComEC/Rec2 family competence protein [Oscillospiraceae bacterium]|jgi:competence protein ComEC|nr:ComEC/Rec2 family competence protein [Oscillospiraceae bacterium]